MQSVDRLIVAADFSTRDEVLSLVDQLQDSVGLFKIGLQAFIANGPALVREVVSRGASVFLDLKLHDIPNTVQHAVAEAAQLNVTMLTVHAAGGASMLRAAANGRLLILAVTILTSLDENELAGIGMTGSPLDNATRLAKLAAGAGLRGVVASPHEIRAIRNACGPELKIVVPGIRPSGAEAGDQKRTMTPAEAIREGADYIVVGRPITGAKNRRDAALRIVEEMSGGQAP